MTFQQFQNMINRIDNQANREQMPFHIAKDLFDLINLRKQNYLDINEFLQFFKFSTPEPYYQKELAAKNPTKSSVRHRPYTPVHLERLQLVKEKKKIMLPNNHIHNEEVRIESSIHFDMVVKVIGRNRKFLFDEFKIQEQKGIKIDYLLVKQIIGELMHKNGYSISEQYWPYLLKFANKQGIIDYRFLLDTYKQKDEKVDQIPRQVK